MKRAILFLLLYVLAIGAIAQSDSSAQTINKKRLLLVSGVETAFYVGGMLYLSEIWYRDWERVPFHWYNDNAGYLQMDKLAHSFVAYQESKAGYHALRWSGVSKGKALLFGGTLGFVLQLPVEIFDGIYEDYGFSPGDVAANTLGSLLFITQEGFWDEQKVVMKFSYYPSEYAQYRPDYLGANPLEQLFLDYNSQTYWLSANIRSIFHQAKVPAWLNLAVGYSGDGMLGEFTNPRVIDGKLAPVLTRERQFLLSLDVDFTRIPTSRPWLKKTFKALNVLKIPFPALEYTKKRGLNIKPLYY
ncbi:DUF2279 domain-containing protein [Cytophagales bacterium LB-30]|uniref:DUF2279 domain-containing protein n=1 Tax=Shiella aurantiaca TaxID=3058365 RepID=A0ABT8F526_9BACT|nr:DUF2279 domain-containing protein [Shiella aurantiaca]MDN4165568.1 DUF2279 domain-containing protein [Shiella aurantiaca]